MDRNSAQMCPVPSQSVSLSARRAWIEIKVRSSVVGVIRSLSARRAWIEIPIVGIIWRVAAVALRKESVDRNAGGMLICLLAWVALRKESVDRNMFPSVYA